MKKTLFVKFLFLLLCGSVLTTAGCKDYDDDIDALRNDVEDLKGAVVELNGFENRIAALERTQAAFEAIDFSGFAKKSDISSLQTQIEGCVKDSDLAAKIVAAIESSLADGALQENLNSLKSGILEEIAGIYATQETLESVQETLENMIELKKDAAGFSLEVTQLIESYLSDNGFEAAGGELTDSQVSQIDALMLPNRLDHFIKEQLHIEGYSRYMDDGYLIHESRDYLQECLKQIRAVCADLGIRMNEKKTRIVKLQELHFLKTRFYLTETGKVRRKMCRKSARRMRRKLKTFRRWMAEGRMTEEDIRTAYESWRGHMRRGNSYRVLRRMDRFYKRLMEKGA